MAFKPHFSQTSIAAIVALAVITTLFGWTGYNYFMTEVPEPEQTYRPSVYYNDAYDDLVAELEKFDAYKIDLSTGIPIGTNNPFEQ